ncbi:MAG TPA: pilus assembly protein TadG-related protein [Clostridia bacterium]|nr:pilus assembly protein TadG-related protein [Clostridia bacterium]
MYRGNDGREKEKGAITVFLSIIFMTLVIFAGVVIDISRITAAERKVQGVLNSSARSVLAGYDRELVGGYGIYGINAASDSLKNDFFRYLSVNLEERHRGISFLNIEVSREDIDIRGMDSLLGEEPFKRQVQEYMKYRTVINASEALIEQLKSLKLDKRVDFAKSERTTRGTARELRAKISAVNAKLSSAKKKLADLSAEKLEDIKKELSEALSLSGLIYGGNGGLLEEYNDSIADSTIKAGEGDCIENQSQEFASIQAENEELSQALQSYISEVSRTYTIVKPLQKELDSLKKELSDLKDELSDLKDELSELEEEEGGSSGKRGRLKDEINEVEEEIDEVRDRISMLESRIEDELEKLKEKLSEIPLKGYSLKDEAVELAGTKLEELKASIGRIKREIEASLLRRLEPEWMIGAGEFEAASLVSGGDFGEMNENIGSDVSIGEEEAEESNNRLMENLEKLSEAVKSAASGAVEKVNTIEYVMDNFTFLTSKTERGHYFRKGEVEYIIGGAEAEAGSRVEASEYYVVTRVFLQVWALRFAIDTIDDFVRSAIVSPPQRLAFALAEGAVDSCADMLDMMNGEGVPICPKSFTGVKLKYSDHLRILLLLKPEQEILRKARQLMQVNIRQVVDAETGLPRSAFRLGDYSTVIEASVKAKVNLFFFPVLKVDRLMPGSFENGKYVVYKKIYVGY